MADTGFTFGTGLFSADGSSDLSWSSPTALWADDGSTASVSYTNPPSPLTVYALAVKTFGFSIPSDATIDGFEIYVDDLLVDPSTGTGNSSFFVGLADGNTFAKIGTPSSSITSSGSYTVGSPTDMWGTTLTPADVNDTEFSVYIDGIVDGTGLCGLSVDSVQVKVYYTPAPPTIQSIKVESFDVDITTSGSTHTLTNDVGNVSNAFVRKITSTDKATGLVGNTDTMTPNNAHCGVQLTDTDELTFYKNNANTQKIVGEVWRYEGASGGDNEFIVRGTYAITVTGASATQAVSGLTNRNKAVPIYNGSSYTGTTTNDYDSATVGVYINSSDEIVVERQATTGTLTVYVTVVEFTGSNWSVGHAISSSHDTTTETITLNTDSTGTGGSTFDVGDWSTAMIIDASMQGDTAETGIADVCMLVSPTSASTTQIDFSMQDADIGARNDGNAYAHVIQHDDLLVYRAKNTNLAEGNNTYTTTAAWPSGAPTTSDLDQLSMEWFVSSSGTGTAHARGRLTARITDPTGTIQNWVQRSGNTVYAYYGVADFSGVNDPEPSGGFNSSFALNSNIVLGASFT